MQPMDKSTEEESAKSAPPRRRARKIPIALGTLAVILVAAGAGFWVWHEQPSFCNAICHTPMDPYLPTYEAEPGGEAVDKWGNEVEDAGAMLAASHRASAKATCLDCHVPTLSEQVTEGVAWVTGGYDVDANEAFGVVLVEKDLAALTEARGIDEDRFCLNEECHVGGDGMAMTRDDLVSLTDDMARNPHVAQHGEFACSDCHKAHRSSVNACTQCHSDAEVPRGWLSVAEAKRLG